MAEIIMENKDKDWEDHGQIFFNWTFSEFPKYERDGGWYFAGALVVVLFLLFAVLTANFLFGLIVLMAALIILLFHRSDAEIEFRITEDGILLNQKFYDYKAIKNFYIIYEPPEVKTLYFEPKSFFSPRIPIPLTNQDPIKLRDILRQYLEEDLDREDEPVSDQTSRFFKL